MNNENEQWVKRSERTPSEHAYPISVWSPESKREHMLVDRDRRILPDTWTHWRCLPRVAPPPRELTQREQDEAAAVSAVRRYFSVPPQGYSDADVLRLYKDAVKEFLSLIHAERKAVLAMLNEANVKRNGRQWGETPESRPVTRRLEEQGQP